MKNLAVKSILLAFTLLLFGCDCKECETELEKTQNELSQLKTEHDDVMSTLSCRNEIPDNDYDDMSFDLLYDCENQNEYQHMHLDLKNGFGIMAKITMNNQSGVENLEFRLKEVGSCNRYYISNPKYIGSRIVKGKKLYDISIQIDAANGRTTQSSIPIDGEIKKISQGEFFDIHLQSTVDEIPSTKIKMNSDGSYSFEKVDLIDYGQQFCKSKIILGNGG